LLFGSKLSQKHVFQLRTTDYTLWPVPEQNGIWEIGGSHSSINEGPMKSSTMWCCIAWQSSTFCTSCFYLQE